MLRQGRAERSNVSDAEVLSLADSLSGVQQCRLLMLSRASRPLPWMRPDDALATLGLVQRSVDGAGKEFAEIGQHGLAVASAL